MTDATTPDQPLTEADRLLSADELADAETLLNGAKTIGNESRWVGLYARRLLSHIRAQSAEEAWRTIESAPRDGTHILLAFGQDGVSEGWWDDGYDTEPHPWKFVDTGGPTPPGERPALGFINASRDEKYGPSHWQPMPRWLPRQSLPPHPTAQAGDGE